MKIDSLLENITPSSAPNREGGQAPVFGRSEKFLEDEKIEETTTSGSVTTVAQPTGQMQRRAKGSIFAGISTSEKFPNSKSVEEDKIKGADGKACWKGKRYAGTKNGKDICVPVTEGIDACHVCGQTPCNCTHITESAYNDGVSDGMQGTPNRRASSIYGPETGEYEKGYAVGVQKGKEQQQARVTQAQQDSAQYEQMSDEELIQLRKEIQQRSQQRQQIYQKLRGSDYSFDPKRHRPANHAELQQQNQEDNKAWNTINQVLWKRGVNIDNLEESKPGLWANIHAKRERIKHGSGERMRKPGSKGAPSAQDFKDSQKTSKTDEAANPAQQAAIAIAMKKKGQKPKNENEEYDDEAGMADNNIETLRRAVEGLDELIQPGDNLPEWCQEKIAQAKGTLVGVWDYMKSEEDRGAVEEDWQKVNKSDKTDGMSPKAVKAYRRENPGSKLKTAVTTKPSKLKAGSKDAKRRKSFCARMSGNKGPMKDEKGRPTPKAKALRRWNCEESINEVSDETLMSYLTKVDADARKHKSDPTKRDPKKASKSVSGFSRAFNKLDARKGVAEGTEQDDPYKGITPSENVKEGRFVTPKEPKPPKSSATASLKQLEKNKRENPGQSPFKTQDEKVAKYLGQGVAEGLPQTLRKVVPGYAKREIDKKMDAGKFGKTDADKDANFHRYKKIQDKLKESEQVYNILALDKGNALKKPTKLKWKASSLEDIFDALAAQDWYPLEINGVEVIAGKRLKQGVAEGAKVDRMVKHIAKSERGLGKSKKEAENIAWATVNKRGYLDNKNKKAHESIEEGELTEEQLLAKKLKQELELFRQAIDKELSKRPSDKEIQKKQVDEILGFQIGRGPKGDIGPPTVGAKSIQHAPNAEDEQYVRFNKKTGDTEFFVVHRVGNTFHLYKKNRPGTVDQDKLEPTGLKFESPPESAHHYLINNGFKWFNQEWWKA